jgi:ribonucleoside-diphosphate reductase alpha chain
MYFYAWKKGLKTTYYLRSRPATRIAKATIATTAAAPAPIIIEVAPAPVTSSEYSDADAVACSLENPESCEACQ